MQKQVAKFELFGGKLDVINRPTKADFKINSF